MKMDAETSEMTFQCHFCDKPLNHFKSLMIHYYRSHHHCMECEVQLEDIEELLSHIEKVHDEDVRCSECPFYAFDIIDVKRHMLLHHKTSHKKQIFQCKNCNFNVLSNFDSFKMHCLITHLFCSDCQKILDTRDTAIEHMVSVHKQKVKCDNCSFVTLNSSTLERHVQGHNNGSFEAAVCNCKFCMSTNFGSMEKANFSCKFCDFKRPCMHELKKHLSGAHDFCFECGLQLANKLENLLHQASEHQFCDNCQNSFNDIDAHMRSTHSIIIQNVFNDIEEQRIRRKLEDEELKKCQKLPNGKFRRACNYPCKLCGSLRMSKSDLRDHGYAMHNFCIDCNKNMESQDAIFEHIEIEHGIKVKCEFCSYRTTQKNYLTLHLKSHKEEMKKRDISSPKKDFKRRRKREPTSMATLKLKEDLQCKICSVIEKNLVKLKNHYYFRHSFCQECDSQLFDRKETLAHMFSVHSLKVYCSHCKYDSYDVKLVERHIQRVHGIRKTNQRGTLVCCQFCKAENISSAQIINHCKDMHNFCVPCGHQFQTKKQIQDHMMKVHKSVEPKAKRNEELRKDERYTCKFCRKVNSCSFDHKRHNFKIHHFCLECQTQLKNRQETLEHMSTVHYNKVFCEFCDYANFEGNYMKGHMKRMHGMEFDPRPVNLMTCKFCKVQNFTAPRLERHYKEEHYFCMPCGLHFESSSGLQTHINSKHPEEDEEMKSQQDFVAASNESAREATIPEVKEDPFKNIPDQNVKNEPFDKAEFYDNFDIKEELV